MRIQHNIMAMNAYRNYSNNTSALSKNLEKLSSGYKINRAGDDAAGLAISEKMRAQITGLNQAQANAKSGINLVQTAEGALTEVHDMLNRMVKLADQSANGTYDNETDRENLQKEVDALQKEINRIADASNFNGIKLLDGSLQNAAATTSQEYTEKAGGADRMIQDLIAAGDKPVNVVGTKTVLDATNVTASKTKFTVDLDNVSATIKGSGSAGVSATKLGFTLSVGTATFNDNNLAGTQDTSDTTFTGTQIANSIFAKMTADDVDAGVAGVQVTLGGVNYTVTYNSDSKLTFEMVNAPASATEIPGNFDVKVSSTLTDDKGTLKGSNNVGTYVVNPGALEVQGARANTVFSITNADIVDGAQITIDGKSVVLAVGADSKYAEYADADAVVDLTGMEAGSIDLDVALSKISNSFGSGTTNFTVGVSNNGAGHAVGLSVQHNSDTVVYDTAEKLGAVFSIGTLAEKTTEATNALTLQIGDTSEPFNKLTVSIRDMHCEALGVDISKVNIKTQEGASNAVKAIKDAINTVSSVRGDLGATQNRLEHTINNLSVMTENIQDAESTIRDVDVADEMMAYTKNNILVQSAQAMLAQANQVPQGVLQLLQ